MGRVNAKIAIVILTMCYKCAAAQCKYDSVFTYVYENKWSDNQYYSTTDSTLSLKEPRRAYLDLYDATGLLKERLYSYASRNDWEFKTLFIYDKLGRLVSVSEGVRWERKINFHYDAAVLTGYTENSQTGISEYGIKKEKGGYLMTRVNSETNKKDLSRCVLKDIPKHKKYIYGNIDFLDMDLWFNSTVIGVESKYPDVLYPRTDDGTLYVLQSSDNCGNPTMYYEQNAETKSILYICQKEYRYK